MVLTEIKQNLFDYSGAQKSKRTLQLARFNWRKSSGCGRERGRLVPGKFRYLANR